MSVTAWTGAFTAAYQDLCSRLDRDEEPWIDPYAAQDPAEFFAVCSELFFDVPDELREEYPVLYEQLKRYYKQDPAAAS
jgi:Mlc titration factor MtfA (ptsG expression regulator)